MVGDIEKVTGVNFINAFQLVFVRIGLAGLGPQCKRKSSKDMEMGSGKENLIEPSRPWLADSRGTLRAFVLVNFGWRKRCYQYTPQEANMHFYFKARRAHGIRGLVYMCSPQNICREEPPKILTSFEHTLRTPYENEGPLGTRHRHHILNMGGYHFFYLSV